VFEVSVGHSYLSVDEIYIYIYWYCLYSFSGDWKLYAVFVWYEVISHSAICSHNECIYIFFMLFVISSHNCKKSKVVTLDSLRSQTFRGKYCPRFQGRIVSPIKQNRKKQGETHIRENFIRMRAQGEFSAL
jgi:hypothetical protein